MHSTVKFISVCDKQLPYLGTIHVTLESVIFSTQFKFLFNVMWAAEYEMPPFLCVCVCVCVCACVSVEGGGQEQS
jgi:hypothetical protein